MLDALYLFSTPVPGPRHLSCVNWLVKAILRKILEFASMALPIRALALPVLRLAPGIQGLSLGKLYVASHGLGALCDRAVCADMQTCVGDIAHRCGSARQASRSAVRREFSCADPVAGLGLCPVGFSMLCTLRSPCTKAPKTWQRLPPMYAQE